MGQLSEEQKEQLKRARERQLEVAVFPDTGRVVPEIGTQFVVTGIKENVLDFHDGICTVVELALLDSHSQGAGFRLTANEVDDLHETLMNAADELETEGLGDSDTCAAARRWTKWLEEDSAKKGKK